MFKRKTAVVDDGAQLSEWYLGDAGADATKKKLNGQPDGYFAVRNSSSQPGNFVLSYNFKGGTKNLHIDGEGGGVRLSKSTVTFKNLSELVKHYSENETGELQCVLTGANIVSAEDVKTLKRQQKKEAKQKSAADRTSSFGGTLKKGATMNGEGALGAQWKVSDVCDWLLSMDMPEYVPAFKKSKVDGVVLLQLDDNKLRDLGVGAFQQRKKLVTSIETLNNKFKAMMNGNAPPSGGAAAAAPAPAGQGAQPVPTIGLIARNINGKVKIFDIETGTEVLDIAAHQRGMHERLAQQGLQPHEVPPGYIPPPLNGAAPPPAQTPAAAPPVAEGPWGRIGVPEPSFTAQEHQDAPWYDENLVKGKIKDVLEAEGEGAFVLRDSSSNPGCFAFSYLAAGKVQHKLIEEDDGGFYFRGSEDRFSNLSCLVTFYTHDQGGILKVKLKLPTHREKTPVRRASLSESSGPALPAKSQAPGLDLETAAWNCLQLGRDAALAKISGAAPGSFVIRPSDKAYAAISVIKPDGSMYHQHIEAVDGGLQMKKSAVVHADLVALVQYYASASQKDIPCSLTL
eukprot:m.383085 g.383085  ORF g.383085 m.383085 type:complete len:568 (+) comp20980_c1_seq3:321-2024(+)